MCGDSESRGLVIDVERDVRLGEIGVGLIRHLESSDLIDGRMIIEGLVRFRCVREESRAG